MRTGRLIVDQYCLAPVLDGFAKQFHVGRIAFPVNKIRNGCLAVYCRELLFEISLERVGRSKVFYQCIDKIRFLFGEINQFVEIHRFLRHTQQLINVRVELDNGKTRRLESIYVPVNGSRRHIELAAQLPYRIIDV